MVTIQHWLAWLVPEGPAQRVYMILFTTFALWAVVARLLGGKRDDRDDQGEKDTSFLLTLAFGMLLSRIFCDWHPFFAKPWPFYVAGVVGILLGAILIGVYDGIRNTIAKIRREIKP